MASGGYLGYGNHTIYQKACERHCLYDLMKIKNKVYFSRYIIAAILDAIFDIVIKVHQKA